MAGANVSHWWSDGGYQAAFGRQGRGFIVFNADWEKKLDAEIEVTPDKLS